MNYYYAKNEEKIGPLSLDELKKIELKKDTLVWYEGLDDWVKAEEVKELGDFFKVSSSDATQEKPKIPILSKFPLFVFINIIPLYLFFIFFYYPESEIYDPNSFGIAEFLGSNFILLFSLLIGLFKQIKKQTWIIIIVIQWVLSLIAFLGSNSEKILNYIL